MAETGTYFVGVATTAGRVKLLSAGGELPIGLAGVSNTCDGAGSRPSGEETTAFDGVAKIILRTNPEEKDLVFGALEGVSAIFECARLRTVELRRTVAGTTEDGGRAADDGMQKLLEGGASVVGGRTNGSSWRSWLGVCSIMFFDLRPTLGVAETWTSLIIFRTGFAGFLDLLVIPRPRRSISAM